MTQGYTHRWFAQIPSSGNDNQKQYLMKDLVDAASAIVPNLPRMRVLQIDQDMRSSGEWIRASRLHHRKESNIQVSRWLEGERNMIWITR